MSPARCIWVRKAWLFWQAINPDELLDSLDTHTVIRALSRDVVIEKARRRWFDPKPNPWEEIVLSREADRHRV